MSTSKICRDCGAEELETSISSCLQCGGVLQRPLRTPETDSEVLWTFAWALGSIGGTVWLIWGAWGSWHLLWLLLLGPLSLFLVWAAAEMVWVLTPVREITVRRLGFLAPVREKLIMPQCMRDLLCGLDWGHTGTWAYDKGPYECNQTRICLRCGEKSSRIQHAVEHWTPNGGWFFLRESGVCIRCKRWQTQAGGTD